MQTTHVAAGTTPRRPCVPTVQLRHVLSDGSEHIDWLIAREAAGTSPLLTFRLPRAVHELEAGEELVIERLADHRAAYLTFEGDIGRGRGRVTRIAQGHASVRDADEGAWGVEVEWTAPESGPRRQVASIAPRERCSAGGGVRQPPGLILRILLA